VSGSENSQNRFAALPSVKARGRSEAVFRWGAIESTFNRCKLFPGFWLIVEEWIGFPCLDENEVVGAKLTEAQIIDGQSVAIAEIDGNIRTGLRG
jgi:hypothetical protein